MFPFFPTEMISGWCSERRLPGCAFSAWTFTWTYSRIHNAWLKCLGGFGFVIFRSFRRFGVHALIASVDHFLVAMTARIRSIVGIGSPKLTSFFARIIL